MGRKKDETSVEDNVKDSKKTQSKKNVTSEDIPSVKDSKKKHRVKSEPTEDGAAALEDVKETLKDIKPKKKNRHKESVAEEDTSENEKPKKSRKRKSETLEDDEDDIKPKKTHSKKSKSGDAVVEIHVDVHSNESRKKKHKKSHESGEDVATETSEDAVETSKTEESKKNRKKKVIKSAAIVESDEDDNDAEVPVDTSEKRKKRHHKHSETSDGTPTTSTENSTSPKKRLQTNAGTFQEPPKKIPAIKFIDLIHDLNEYGKEKLQNHKGKPNILRLVGSIPELQQYHDFFNEPTFKHDFDALYTTAMSRKNISMDLVVTVLNRYLNDGDSVEKFDDFPKPPMAPHYIYASEHKDAAHSTLKNFTKLRQQFTSGEIDTKPYYDQYAKACEKYIEELKQYLCDNSMMLRESHTAHINNMIKKTYNTIHSKDFGIIKKKPQQKATTEKKKKKTAFDWFIDANPEAYADRDDETRTRKLERKFNKLPEEERNVYEKIAAANA